MIVSLILGLCIHVQAQQKKIDSLQSLLPGKPDSMRTKILYELAYEYVDFNDSLGAMYGALAFECARQIGDSLGMVKGARIRATAFRRLEELDSAIATALRVLPVARRNNYSREVKQLLRGIALAYTYKANYALGLRYNFELLKIAEWDHDTLETAFALNNIGLAYFKLSNHKKALQYYQRVMETKFALDRFNVKTLYINISLCNAFLQDFPKAREFLEKSIAIHPLKGPSSLETEVQHASGILHRFKGSLDSAEVCFLKSYALAKQQSKRRYHLIAIMNLIDVYVKRNQISLARRYLLEGESIIQGMPNELEVMGLYQRALPFYQKIDNKKKLSFYQEKYIRSRNAIYAEALANNLIKIQNDYVERGANGKIAEQEQLLALQDQVIKRQRAFNILVIILTVLLILFLYLLYRDNAEKKLVNRLLEQRVKERTGALEHSHRLFQQAFISKDASIAKTFGIVRQHMATLRGLCAMALRDGDRSQGENRLQQLAVVTSDVVLTLDKISDTKVEYDL